MSSVAGVGQSQTSPGSKECPYCKEKIRDGAILCRYCGSELPTAATSHGGVCPYCKEDIKPEAIRCRYCRSDLRPVAPAVQRSSSPPTPETAGSGCAGCSGGSQNPMVTARRLGGSTGPRAPGFGDKFGEGGRECITKVECGGEWWSAGIPVCRIYRCCFSDTIGTWGCIEL
jgi:hypothetical protein